MFTKVMSLITFNSTVDFLVVRWVSISGPCSCFRDLGGNISNFIWQNIFESRGFRSDLVRFPVGVLFEFSIPMVLSNFSFLAERSLLLYKVRFGFFFVNTLKILFYPWRSVTFNFANIWTNECIFFKFLVQYLHKTSMPSLVFNVLSKIW